MSPGTRGGRRVRDARETKHPLAFAAVAVLLLVGLAAVGTLAFPPRVAVVAYPEDARISLMGGPSAVGRLDTTVPRPGEYTVAVTRTGYATDRTRVRAQRVPAGPQVIRLRPLEQRLFISAEPESTLISVYDGGGKRVAFGRRRVQASLPAATYLVVATAPDREPVRTDVALARPTNLHLVLDLPGAQVRTAAAFFATGVVRNLGFNADGTLVRATLNDPPPPREVFSVTTSRRLPDAATANLADTGFRPGNVGTSVVDRRTGTRYEVDRARSAIVVKPKGKKPSLLARTASPPRLIGLAQNGRTLVVSMDRSWNRDGQPMPGLVILRVDGQLLESVDSPAVTAMAIATDGRTVAVADTPDGRIRVLRLPRSWRRSPQ